MKQRLDTYDTMPQDMRAYLSNYGWHFNKHLCEWAISQMRDKNKSKITPYDKEKVETMLKQYGVEIPSEKIYDAVYVLHMALLPMRRTLQSSLAIISMTQTAMMKWQ